MKVKVIKVEDNVICFSNKWQLYSDHYPECCEEHYLCMNDLTLDDFDGLEFDISGHDFFRRVEGYGIELIPICGWAVRIPGYCDNNGFYSNKMTLVLEEFDADKRTYDITQCQPSCY